MTTINRAAILKSLNLAKQALGTPEQPHPVYQCFQFHPNNKVTAFNGAISITAKNDTGLQGICINGATLIGMLGTLPESFELNQGKDSATIKTKHGDTKIPVLSIEDAPAIPVPSEAVQIFDLTPELLKQLELGMLSVNDKNPREEHRCLHLTVNTEGAFLYGSDNATIMKCSLGKILKAKADQHYHLPAALVQQLIQIAGQTKPEQEDLVAVPKKGKKAAERKVKPIATIRLSGKDLTADFGEQCTLIGLLPEHKAIDMDRIIDDFKPTTKAIEFPEGFAQALDRINWITKDEQKAVTLTLEKSEMTLLAQGDMGNIDETFKVKVPTKTKLEGKFNAGNISRILPHAKEFNLIAGKNRKVILATGQDFIYIATAFE